LCRSEPQRGQVSEQTDLFGSSQESEWRSTRSVSRRNQPPTSSER
jgi:hypothetical protein